MQWINLINKLSIFYTKLSRNKLLMVLSNLADFCFHGRKNEYITVRSRGACCLKDIKDDQTSLNKQHIKDAGAYLLFSCYFTLVLRYSFRLLVFHGVWSNTFFANLLCDYKSKWMNETKNKELIKVKQFWKKF